MVEYISIAASAIFGGIAMFVKVVDANGKITIAGFLVGLGLVVSMFFSFWARSEELSQGKKDQRKVSDGFLRQIDKLNSIIDKQEIVINNQQEIYQKQNAIVHKQISELKQHTKTQHLARKSLLPLYDLEFEFAIFIPERQKNIQDYLKRINLDGKFLIPYNDFEPFKSTEIFRKHIYGSNVPDSKRLEERQLASFLSSLVFRIAFYKVDPRLVKQTHPDLLMVANINWNSYRDFNNMEYYLTGDYDRGLWHNVMGQRLVYYAKIKSPRIVYLDKNLTSLIDFSDGIVYLEYPHATDLKFSLGNFRISANSLHSVNVPDFKSLPINKGKLFRATVPNLLKM